jgi:hypothetical protein
MAIENSFRPYLQSMLDGDVSFYYDANKAADFLYGMCVQYLRTKQVREAIISAGPWRSGSIERVWNVISHILSVNLGFSLFADRDHFRIILVDNNTSVPFITGDQPIVNLCGKPKDRNPPEKVELYYPLSPKKAMLFIEKANQARAVQSSVTMEEAHSYNLFMSAHSFQQLFSNSQEYLRVIKSTREQL